LVVAQITRFRLDDSSTAQLIEDACSVERVGPPNRAVAGWASDVLLPGGLETVTLNVSADSRLLRTNALAHADGCCVAPTATRLWIVASLAGAWQRRELAARLHAESVLMT
jgi:hypothetical protein